MLLATAAGKTKRVPGPVALINSPGTGIMMLSFLTASNYLRGKKALLLCIDAKMIVLPVPR